MSIADDVPPVLGYALEAAPAGTRMVAGIPAPVGMVCAVTASLIASRMMVSCVPHFAPMFGGFAVLTPGM